MLLLLVAGCNESPPATSRDASPSATGKPTAPSAEPAASASAQEPDAGSAKLAALPERLARLGQPCEADGAEASVRWLCSDGRVSAVAAPVDMVRGIPPDGATVLVDWERERQPKSMRMPSLRVAREGTRLWVRYVTCRACRRVMGIAAVADLDRLAPAQTVELRKWLQLSGDGALHGVAEWQRAFEAHVARSE